MCVRTYPRSLGRPYYARVLSTEGVVMRRHDGGIGCGARGRGTNASSSKLPGGAGAPPAGTMTRREELADGRAARPA